MLRWGQSGESAQQRHPAPCLQQLGDNRWNEQGEFLYRDSSCNHVSWVSDWRSFRSIWVFKRTLTTLSTSLLTKDVLDIGLRLANLLGSRPVFFKSGCTPLDLQQSHTAGMNWQEPQDRVAPLQHTLLIERQAGGLTDMFCLTFSSFRLRGVFWVCFGWFGFESSFYFWFFRKWWVQLYVILSVLKSDRLLVSR